jgi:hypothetical protein
VDALRRALRCAAAGAVTGCALTALDGLLCGLAFASTADGVLLWLAGFALAGAGAGARVGLLAAAVGGRLVLRPPDPPGQKVREEG